MTDYLGGLEGRVAVLIKQQLPLNKRQGQRLVALCQTLKSFGANDNVNVFCGRYERRPDLGCINLLHGEGHRRPVSVGHVRVTSE